MKNILGTASILVSGLAILQPALAVADQASTIAALRMNGNITGGLMPTTNAAFTTMVTDIEKGDYFDAAMAAINTPYFAQYLGRQMAKEMQNPTLSSSGVPDNDATTFVLAHLLYGTTAAATSTTGLTKGISGLWSDNLTCDVNNGTANVGAFTLTAAQLNAVNWDTAITCTAGQTVMSSAATPAAMTLPAVNVGGYTTLSSAIADQSFAQNAFTAGTNLRGIEYIYEISTGLALLQMAITDGASPSIVAPFVPESDPNFLVGSGQPACISCHGGGTNNLLHGYATVADIFDFDPKNGFTYIAAPLASTKPIGTNGGMKSLGSMPATRVQVANCIANHAYPTGFTTCNPDSIGLGTNSSQNWDLTSWQQGGLLTTMGWTGAITGTGLNSLGTALGQASGVYSFMVQRVINDICPTGSVTAASQAAIAAQGQVQDSFAYIVASVASDPSCR